MRRAGIVFVMMAGLASGTAGAREPAADDYVNQEIPEGANVWHCWYDGSVSVRCRLGEAAAVRVDAATDPRLPEVVRKVWNQAADLADSVVTIPLHTVPFDMAMTGRLAAAVMCGGATQPCGIVFAPSESRLAAATALRQTRIAARRLGGLALAD